jgi:hypothetical protein
MEKITVELDLLQARRLKQMISESRTLANFAKENIEADPEIRDDLKQQKIVNITRKTAADNDLFRELKKQLSEYIKQCNEQIKKQNEHEKQLENSL